MVIISPEKFKEAFLIVAKVVNNEAELVRLWALDARKYTDFMLRTLLPDVAVQLTLQVYTKDYYLMDSVFYEGMHTGIFPPNQYIKYIAIAFEHEQTINGSQAEIHRLQIYNTPLKVLVTYPTRRMTINNDALPMYSKIIASADIFSDFSTLRKQLVIFGSFVGNTIDWNFFVYRDGGFVQI